LFDVWIIFQKKINTLNDMKKYLYLRPVYVLMIIILFCCTSKHKISDKPHILLITGGHSFDTIQFFEMFYDFEDMDVDTISQPQANALLETDELKKYDVLVFYDMWQDITDQQKTGLLGLLKEGKGMVFLHHSLVSYQGWDEFIYIIGGRYNLENDRMDTSKISGFEHDLDIKARIINKTHPITSNMPDFTIHDEGYYNIEIIPAVHPLLEVNHPSCAKCVAWTNKYENSRIVYILLGHDRHAYQNESFRLLVENAVKWSNLKIPDD